jgi:hypothetical protein
MSRHLEASLAVNTLRWIAIDRPRDHKGRSCRIHRDTAYGLDGAGKVDPVAGWFWAQRALTDTIDG